MRAKKPKVREELKLASGDYVDMKMFEPAIGHLLDTYIRAEESEKVSAFDDMTLVQLIVQRALHSLQNHTDHFEPLRSNSTPQQRQSSATVS